MAYIPKEPKMAKTLKTPPWPINISVCVQFEDWKKTKKGIIKFNGYGYHFYWENTSRELNAYYPVVVIIESTNQIWDPFC